MDNNLTKITEDLWLSYCENPNMEPKSWLPFLHHLCGKFTKKYADYSVQGNNGLITLGKTKDLVFFLVKGECEIKSIIKASINEIERMSLTKTENIYIFVLNPFLSGISLFLFSFKTNESVKTIHFSSGKIPNYFQEVIKNRSTQNSDPLELLQKLFDVHTLEIEFLSDMKKRIAISDTELRNSMISYLSIFIVFSHLSSINNNFIDWLRSELCNSKQITLQDCIQRIQEFNLQQVIHIDEISKLGAVFNDIGWDTLPLDTGIVQDFIQRYPFSLNEPTAFIQEVAITPLVLSEIAEDSFISSSKTKKEGKYYTSAANAEFISYLAVYRLLSIKLICIKSDDLFKWVFHDWGLMEKQSIKISMDQLSKIPRLRVLDPACGTGTFLLSVSRLFCRLTTLRSIADEKYFPIVELIGIDRDKIAVLITRIRLIFFEILVFSNISHMRSEKRAKFPIIWSFKDIIKGDFFNCKKVYKKNYDLVLGNPPWVRHEDIGIGQVPEYKELIQNQIREVSNTHIYFDRKSDFYVYFCLMGLSLLKNNGGIFAFLTSNAWLEVKYGQTLQKFLLDPNKQLTNFDIIYQSGKRLWDRLGINSIILIVEKSSSDQATLLGGIFTEIKVNFPQIPLSSLKKGLILRSEYKDRFCRTEQIPLKLLKKTHKWAGTFLRMSHSERKVIYSIENKGVPLSDLADVRFGIKTGANDFFHLQRFGKQGADRKVKVKNRIGYEGLVEEKYLVPLIKSPSHIKGFIIPHSFIPRLWLFYCLDSPSQLQGSEAWTYIKWGESVRVTIKQGKKSGNNIMGFSSVHSVKHRNNWYAIGSYPIPSLLWTKSYHDKSGCFYNQAKMMPDQRFYGIIVKEKEHLPLIFTFLNSSLVWAQMEAQGNTNMGFGVLDTNVYWLRDLKIPIEAMVEKSHIKTLMEKLILEENRLPMLDYSKTRIEIDRFYAKHLDLSDSSMTRLYEFISRSIKNRLQ